jgi:hypothetical protein
MLLTVGCKQIQYIPVEKIHTETKYLTNTVRDSIHIHDSINIYTKNDTVYRVDVREYYRNRLVIDTMLVFKTDSIPVIREVPVVITKTKRDVFWWAGIGAIIMLIIYIYGKCRIK